MMYEEMNYDGKFLIIPNEEVMRRDLLNVDRRTKEIVRTWIGSQTQLRML